MQNQWNGYWTNISKISAYRADFSESRTIFILIVTLKPDFI